MTTLSADLSTQNSPSFSLKAIMAAMGKHIVTLSEKIYESRKDDVRLRVYYRL